MQACPITYHHTRSLTLFTQDPFLFFPVFSFTKKEEKYFFRCCDPKLCLVLYSHTFLHNIFFRPVKVFLFGRLLYMIYNSYNNTYVLTADAVCECVLSYILKSICFKGEEGEGMLRYLCVLQ